MQVLHPKNHMLWPRLGKHGRRMPSCNMPRRLSHDNTRALPVSWLCYVTDLPAVNDLKLPLGAGLTSLRAPAGQH